MLLEPVEPDAERIPVARLNVRHGQDPEEADPFRLACIEDGRCRVQPLGPVF